MTTPVILPGSSKTTQDQYVGAVNEITVDQSNLQIRLHDGVTPGGHALLNYDSLLALFQVKVAELAGFNFAPNDKGLLVRIGVANYAFRKVQGTTGQIEISNANGVAGDITLTLPDTITKDLTLGGLVTFSQAIHGNLVGNVTGNVTGNLTGNSTGVHTGDVDLRGHTLQLDDSQVSQAKVNGLAAALAALAQPTGMIVLWSGTVAAIPGGWHLCDGTNGTPDLRGKFVMGATDDSDLYSSGGSGLHNHVITLTAAGTHSHSVTVDGHVLTTNEMPSHFHGSGAGDQGSNIAWATNGWMSGSATNSIANDSPSSVLQSKTTSVGGDQAHIHTASSADAGSHTHAAASADAPNLPPYYKLAYIMKL